MMRRFIFIGMMALAFASIGCQKDAEETTTPRDRANGIGEGTAGAVDWPPPGWAPINEGGGATPPPPASGDFGGECSQPDGCTGDSADWPDCLNTQCSTGDCAYPIFTLDYGYCSRSCIDDSQCQNAMEGPYGSEFKCLTDGVSGICAPGSNERCDHAADGRCDDPNEACKFTLIWAADDVYGGSCQPRTTDGREVGESCDEEAGVYCANDMCLYDTCISLCNPESDDSICPDGFRCYEEWYPFGTDSTIEIDACLPKYCDTDSECDDGFACVLGYQFNRNNILRGICLAIDEDSVQSGGKCCRSEACTAQNDEVSCQGATCFDDEDGVGFCSGMCNTDDDCPGSAYCTITNFGIDAEPGSAPAQLCREGTGSGRDCRTNEDCAADGDIPAEACEYVVRGNLEGGVPVSDPTVGGRCARIPLNAVGYGGTCGEGAFASSCTNEALCLNTGQSGFCSEPCGGTSDCDEGSLCFGIGMTSTLQAGACVEARLVGQTGSSLTSCRRDADCPAEGEHCGLNIIGSSPAVVELLCMANVGAGSGGSACNSAMDCASEICLPQSTDTTEAGYCLSTCRSSADCGEGFTCERQIVDTDYNAEAKICRPAAVCAPCDEDGAQVCGGGNVCSQVQYRRSGPGLACLEPCAGIGANTCADGSTCGLRVNGDGETVADEFVCNPIDANATCMAAMPR